MKWTVKWTKKTCRVPNCYSAIYLDISLIGNQERLVSFFQYQTFFDAAFHGSVKKQKFSFLWELLVVSGNLASAKMTPRIFTKRSMLLALIVICSMWNKSTLSCSCNVGKFTPILYPDVDIDMASCYILRYLFWVQTQSDSLLPWPAFFVKILLCIYIFHFGHRLPEWYLNPVMTITFTNSKKSFFPIEEKSYCIPGFQCSFVSLRVTECCFYSSAIN